jgi:hypothetical protein
MFSSAYVFRRFFNKSVNLSFGTYDLKFIPEDIYFDVERDWSRETRISKISRMMELWGRYTNKPSLFYDCIRVYYIKSVTWTICNVSSIIEKGAIFDKNMRSVTIHHMKNLR